jgi:hypothetical protein
MMLCESISFNNAVLVGGKSSVKTLQPNALSVGKSIFSVEAFTRMELSLVPEVERVLFEHDGDCEFRITSIVNKRSAEIRERVYAGEEEIMKAFPGLNFDFHVIARMDRKIDDVITKAGKLVFER